MEVIMLVIQLFGVGVVVGSLVGFGFGVGILFYLDCIGY